ncbi:MULTISPECIES: hypothetical protein [Dactylosporangium]|uniref:Uncharacterized protein n=2 Tax=Dactylosporangium TaxID=35753 RepID=A0A9W6KH01_9ACTN|nr:MULTISPECIES: hypothetical protein [Dactylosporangium]UAB95681.1 hypothetical protein Dvina_48110 [Dactylosporangium vinaceum]UWZ44037.1 hypothetical protein Dmats_42660 [Dactylosporangium matsuzakiense]GLL00727.1 hypothetical protein GCM10017581_024680 [Dactylosporangium matsuzakiense]
MSVDVSRAKRLRQQLPDAFRLPTEADPRPDNRQIAAVCAWAAALGLGGMAVALRAFVGLISEYRAWYGPVVITIGLLGLACTIAAFASVHRRRLPYMLLATASVTLLIGWVVTGL